MLDPIAAPELTVSRPAPQPAGMNEPGIFKGCAEADGPLAAATKDAILAYLGKPNATSWARVADRAIAGRTTLGQAWAFAAPGAIRRHPNAAELIRAIRLAVARQLTAVNGSMRRAH